MTANTNDETGLGANDESSPLETSWIYDSDQKTLTKGFTSLGPASVQVQFNITNKGVSQSYVYVQAPQQKMSVFPIGPGETKMVNHVLGFRNASAIAMKYTVESPTNVKQAFLFTPPTVKFL